MSSYWKLKAIQVGSIKLDRSSMTHYKGKGELITVPIWCCGATDGKHKVLIDTGIRDLKLYQNQNLVYDRQMTR